MRVCTDWDTALQQFWLTKLDEAPGAAKQKVGRNVWVPLEDKRRTITTLTVSGTSIFASESFFQGLGCITRALGSTPGSRPSAGPVKLFLLMPFTRFWTELHRLAWSEEAQVPNVSRYYIVSRPVPPAPHPQPSTQPMAPWHRYSQKYNSSL